jgi:hypothetical protein
MGRGRVIVFRRDATDQQQTVGHNPKFNPADDVLLECQQIMRDELAEGATMLEARVVAAKHSQWHALHCFAAGHRHEQRTQAIERGEFDPSLLEEAP